MTTRDTPIPWGGYSEGQAENLIAALLVRLHPGAQHVDGAGGDDGADVIVPVAGGIHVFEIKSYNERLDRKQKVKVERSLRTAVAKRPDMVAWTLVLPLNQSPGERRWMQGTLASLAHVPIDWIGRTALESELSGHEDLLRAFAPDAVSHRALAMLSQYSHEALPPTDLADGLRRGDRLRGQFGDLDPHWDFDVQLTAQGQTVFVRAKTDRAFDLSPISVSGTLQAPTGTAEAEAIQRFMEFGTPLSLGPDNVADLRFTLPPALAALFYDHVPTRLEAGPSKDAWASPRPGRLQAVDGQGRVLAALSVHWVEGSAGFLGGGMLRGLDVSGYLELRVVKTAGTAGEISYHAPAGDGPFHPQDILPALRFLKALVGAVQVHLVSADQQRFVIGVQQRDPAASTGALDLAEALVRILVATGSDLAMPTSCSGQDYLHVEQCDRLLRDGWCPRTFPSSSANVPSAAVRQLLEGGPLPRVNLAVASSGPSLPTARLLGAHVTLPRHIRFETRNALITNPLELHRLLQQYPAAPVLPVRLHADSRTSSFVVLVEEQEAEPALADQDAAAAS